MAMRLVPAIAVSCFVASLGSTLKAQTPETSPVRFLTSDSAVADYWPSISPDGMTVLFSRIDDVRKTWMLFTVPTAGGTPRQLSSSPLPVAATRATWSPRGGVIAFTGTSSDRKSSVWLIGSDGTHARQVPATGLSTEVFYPSWYPDGRHLAVMDASELVIKRISLDSLTAVPVTNHEQVLTGMPSVSPDGRWIAFAGQANAGKPYDQTRNSVWVVGETGPARLVEAAAVEGRTPSWSPDGQWLAFESNRGSGPDDLYAVFVIARDGTGLRQITPYELNANHPVWSPDGTKLVFSAYPNRSKGAPGIALADVLNR
jgi:Tol biopolymer transport system component